MAIIYRNALNRPLTNAELDANFEYLYDDVQTRYLISDFTAQKIADELNNPIEVTDGEETRLQTTLELSETNAINAWLLQDYYPSTLLPDQTDKASIVARDALGDFEANNITATLIGNADTATEAAHAATSAALDEEVILGIVQGGTGASTEATARSNLVVLGTAGGETMTGTLKLVTSDVGLSSLRFTAGNEVNSGYQNGDVWYTTAGIRFRHGDVSETVAKVNNQTFTGTTSAYYTLDNQDQPVYSQVATLGHMSDEVATLNGSINLKANIDSPALTGTPTSTTSDIDDNSTRIATTAHVKAYADSTADTYSAQALSDAKDYADDEIDALFTDTTNRGVQTIDKKANIASPTFTGTPKSTTPANDDNSTRIATTNYTVSYVTATLSSYYTKTQVDDLQPKWGDSRKFVQTTAPINPQEGDFWFKV